MNPKKAAEAYRTLSVGFAELADAMLDDVAVPVSTASREPAAPAPAAPSFDELPPEEPFAGEAGLTESEFAEVQQAVQRVTQAPFQPVADEGSEAICPKHRKPYKDGRYGPFCTSTTDDPAWGKERDGKLWCRITPKSAAAWLRNQAAAA